MRRGRDVSAGPRAFTEVKILARTLASGCFIDAECVSGCYRVESGLGARS